jgi:hypothetical protein
MREALRGDQYPRLRAAAFPCSPELKQSFIEIDQIRYLVANINQYQ